MIADDVVWMTITTDGVDIERKAVGEERDGCNVVVGVFSEGVENQLFGPEPFAKVDDEPRNRVLIRVVLGNRGDHRDKTVDNRGVLLLSAVRVMKAVAAVVKADFDTVFAVDVDECSVRRERIAAELFGADMYVVYNHGDSFAVNDSA